MERRSFLKALLLTPAAAKVRFKRKRVKTAAPFQTYTINGNPPASPIIGAGDGITLVVNTDDNNTVYLGLDTSAAANNPNNVAPLLPGAAIPFSGNDDVYAICASGETAVIAVFPGASTFFGVY